jgi:hypothetical protein
VVVDDLNGSFHQSLGASPNLCYIIDKDSRVLFRSLYSNDNRHIRKALELISKDQFFRGESKSRIYPLLKGLRALCGVLDLAGEQAKKDFKEELPLIFAIAVLMGRSSNLNKGHNVIKSYTKHLRQRKKP